MLSTSASIARSAPGPATLRLALTAAGPRSGATIFGAREQVPLGSLIGGTVLGSSRRDLSGRSVMLATAGQFAAARAMIDLDGLVRRMIVCPPDLQAEHRASVLADAEVDTIVTDLDPATFEGHRNVTILGCDHALVPLDRTPTPLKATEWVLATSGTSGAPKLVVHTLAALTAAIAPIGADQRLVWGTFYDIRRYGGMQIFLRAVMAGCSLVLSSAHEPLTDHLARLRQAHVTHLSGTPSHWRRLMMSSEADMICPSTVRLSGEIADQAVLDALAAAFPAATIGHAYASTEAGVGFEVTDGREGFPTAYLDRTGACVMTVAEGTLRIRSTRMADRYLGDAAPALLDDEGYVDTGDVIEQRGDRLYFVGRRGGIINVGGLKVHPEEIEAVINRHPEVQMSLVKSRRSPIMGSIVVADVVLAGGAEFEAVRADIMAACRASLPPHKIPATLRVVPSLDVTPAGKLSRAAS